MHKNPNFEKWFSGSFVVDEAGEPRIVYHGTRSDFSRFEVANSTNNAIFFAETAKHAGHYAKSSAGNTVNGSNIMPVYLCLKDPLIVDYEGQEDLDGLMDNIQQAKAEGRDGVVAKNTNDGYGLVTQYVAFHPYQVKSAIGNSGAYRKEDVDITDSLSRAIKALDWLQTTPNPKRSLHA